MQVTKTCSVTSIPKPKQESRSSHAPHGRFASTIPAPHTPGAEGGASAYPKPSGRRVPANVNGRHAREITAGHIQSPFRPPQPQPGIVGDSRGLALGHTQPLESRQKPPVFDKTLAPISRSHLGALGGAMQRAGMSQSQVSMALRRLTGSKPHSPAGAAHEVAISSRKQKEPSARPIPLSGVTKPSVPQPAVVDSTTRRCLNAQFLPEGGGVSSKERGLKSQTRVQTQTLNASRPQPFAPPLLPATSTLISRKQRIENLRPVQRLTTQSGALLQPPVDISARKAITGTDYTQQLVPTLGKAVSGRRSAPNARAHAEPVVLKGIIQCSTTLKPSQQMVVRSNQARANQGLPLSSRMFSRPMDVGHVNSVVTASERTQQSASRSGKSSPISLALIGAPGHITGSAVKRDITEYVQPLKLISDALTRVVNKAVDEARSSRSGQPIKPSAIYASRPLSISKGQNIRLLNLSEITTAQGQPDLIPLSIQVFDLKKAPPYIALSYVWGHDVPTRVLLVEDQVVLVRPTLYHFFERISQGSDDRLWFWVDNLCIDQDSVSEKNHQVHLMGEIYSRARKVVVWFGPGPPEMRKALRDMPTVPESAEWPTSGPAANDAVVFCSNTYWIRAWTTQEFIRAKEIEFRCGSVTMPYEILRSRAASMYTFITSLKLPNTEEVHAKRMYRMVHMRDWRAGRMLDLHHLFEQLEMEHALCSDLRDRVFSIVSLVDVITKTRYPLVVDYNLSRHELYSEMLDRHRRQYEIHSYGASWYMLYATSLAKALEVQ